MNTWAQLHVGLAVVPGQPLSATWSFGTALSISTGQLKLSFSVIHPLAGKVLINNPTFVPVSGGYAIDGQPLSVGDTISVLPLDDVIGRSVYDIHASNVGGGLPVQLDVVLQGADETRQPVTLTVSATSGYIVVKDLGMEWDGKPLSSASWKSMYQISGQLVNRCQFASISATRLELVELDATDGTERILQITSPGDLAPGDSVSVVAADITQDWRWFGSFEPARSGPTNKQFVYTIDYGYRDQFGNKLPLSEDGIPWYQSGDQTVSVTVSQEKLDHQSSADSEFQAMLITIAWAAVLSAAAGAAWEIPPLAAVFAVAASIASAAAAVLGVIENGDVSAANDPIKPDYRLRTFASLKADPLPVSIGKSSRLANFRSVLSLLSTARAAEDAVYGTLPRVLGAQLSHDRTSYARQLAHAKTSLKSIRATSTQLDRAVQATIVELDKLAAKHSQLLEEARLKVRASGFPAQFKEGLLSSGVPSDIVAHAEDVRDAVLISPMDRKRGTPLTILATALRTVAIRRIKTGASVTTMANKFLRQSERQARRMR